MQEDTLLLTAEERDRLKVLHEVQQGHLTQRRAAAQLKLSTRQVRRLLRRLKRKGDRAVVHALRGRPSNRRIAAKTEQRAIALVRRKYHDFGPTLASEYLANDDGMVVSRETLRGWMIEEGISGQGIASRFVHEIISARAPDYSALFSARVTLAQTAAYFACVNPRNPLGLTRKKRITAAVPA